MPLNISFCEAIGCDQARGGDCNLAGSSVYLMEYRECPQVQQELAKARTEGRQQAAAELDRSTDQPMKTYVEKQSLVNLCVSEAADYEKLKRDSYLIADLKQADEQFERGLTAIEVISSLLRKIVGGALVREVEL